MGTTIVGWDLIAAALVVVERTIAPAAVALTTLFGVALIAFALLVAW